MQNIFKVSAELHGLAWLQYICFSTDGKLGDVLKEKETNFSLHFLDLERFGEVSGSVLCDFHIPPNHCAFKMQNVYLIAMFCNFGRRNGDR